MSVESLGAIPLFENLSPTELEAVAAGARVLEVEAGTEVIRQGDHGAEFYVLTEGELEVLVNGVVVRHLGPGDFLGELALLFGAPRSATAVALVPTSLLVMEKSAFHALMARDPSVETKVMAAVAERLRYR